MSEENEIMLTDGDLSITLGEIRFTAFDHYLGEANKIADYINSLEPTEESLTAGRKVLAAGRKVIRGLERRRIDLKNEYMNPVKEFEQKVATIEKPIQAAVDQYAGKQRIVEERKREAKRDKLYERFELQMGFVPKVYSFFGSMKAAFTAFMQPGYLNVHPSVDAIEEHSMVPWLKNMNESLIILESMPMEFMDAFIACNYDLDAAKEMVESSDNDDEDDDQPSTPDYIRIEIKAEDVATVERLLNEHRIYYSI